jgi:hypothetical protein
MAFEAIRVKHVESGGTMSLNGKWLRAAFDMLDPDGAAAQLRTRHGER